MAYSSTGLQTNALTKQIRQVGYVTYETVPADTAFASDASVEGAGYFNGIADVLATVGTLTHFYEHSTLASSIVTIYGFSNDGTTVTLDTTNKEIVFT